MRWRSPRAGRGRKPCTRDNRGAVATRMQQIPVITGIGLVTPLGNSAAETFDALLAGRHIRDHARTMLDGSSPDRIHRLASAAAGEALGDARWRERRGAESCRTALVAGTSKGAIETWMTAPPAAHQKSQPRCCPAV